MSNHPKDLGPAETKAGSPASAVAVDGPSPHRLQLPDGHVLYLPSRQMWGAARYVYKEIFVHNRYYRPGFEIRPDDTVVDIGANMGLFTMWAASKAPRGRVVAIEPASVAQCLEDNVRLNHLDNVTVVRAAVGKEGETLELVEYPGFNIISHRAGWRPAWTTRFLIRLLYWRYQAPPVLVRSPCRDLGHIMDELGLKTINYLKMDCEGGEYDIFRNIPQDCWDRIERISMEFHELSPGQKHQELVDRLIEQGYQVQVSKTLLEYWFMHFGQIWAWREPGRS